MIPQARWRADRSASSSAGFRSSVGPVPRDMEFVNVYSHMQLPGVANDHWRELPFRAYEFTDADVDLQDLGI